MMWGNLKELLAGLSNDGSGGYTDRNLDREAVAFHSPVTAD